MLIAALFTIAKIQRSTKMDKTKMDKTKMEKKDVVYMYIYPNSRARNLKT